MADPITMESHNQLHPPKPNMEPGPMCKLGITMPVTGLNIDETNRLYLHRLQKIEREDSCSNWLYPLVNMQKTMERSTIF